MHKNLGDLSGTYRLDLEDRVNVLYRLRTGAAKYIADQDADYVGHQMSQSEENQLRNKLAELNLKIQTLQIQLVAERENVVGFLHTVLPTKIPSDIIKLISGFFEFKA